ncbi:DUF2236 domain-containing protein, partial [Rhodococcus hoagii]|nr:DUF2236 domain-containing protein [Prescottella equi]
RRAYREAVNGAHRYVRSDENSPVSYNAFNRELQLWVAACLFIGFEDTHQLLHGRMTPEQAEEFYRSSSTLGTTLQVTEDMWPATRADFDRYWNIACERVAIDETVRDYLNDLLALRMVRPPLRLVFGDLLRFLTTGFLPPLFREQLGMEWNEDDRRRFEHLFVFVSFVNRFVPRFVRHLPSRVLMRICNAGSAPEAARVTHRTRNPGRGHNSENWRRKHCRALPAGVVSVVRIE